MQYIIIRKRDKEVPGSRKETEIMKKLAYTKEENYWEAQVEFGDYYCTGKDGSGLFHIYDGNREQLLGTLQFSVAGLADSTAKRKLRDAVAADKNW